MSNIGVAIQNDQNDEANTLEHKYDHFSRPAALFELNRDLSLNIRVRSDTK